MKKILFIFSILITFTSCSNKELSKEKAIELLKMGNSNNEIIQKHRPSYDQISKKMNNLGLLSFTKVKGGPPNYGTFWKNIKVQGDAKKYLKNKRISYGSPTFEFIVGNKEIDKITGIINKVENKTATVEYTVKYNINEFGKSIFSLNNSEKSKKAKFILYDDGWRLK